MKNFRTSIINLILYSKIPLNRTKISPKIRTYGIRSHDRRVNESVGELHLVLLSSI